MPRLHRFFFLTLLSGMLTSCTSYPRLLNFPADPAGRSVNSPTDDLTPQVTGRYLILTSDRRGSQDVYLYDLQNRQILDLPGLNALDTIASRPGISANGNYIVFAATRKGKSGIYLYNRETRQLRNLTETLQAEVRNPTISADGNIIAFESAANGQWDIWFCDRFGRLINAQ